MNAVIKIYNIPEYQIGKIAQVYFPNSMQTRGKCELLKEQEAVPVYEDKNNKCECGETVCRYWHPKFCGFCGRELLWY